MGDVVEQAAEVLAAHQRVFDGPGSCHCGQWPPSEHDVPWPNHLAAALRDAGLLRDGDGSAREAVERVRKVHVQALGGDPKRGLLAVCYSDGEDWPCETVTALAGDQS